MVTLRRDFLCIWGFPVVNCCDTFRVYLVVFGVELGAALSVYLHSKLLIGSL